MSVLVTEALVVLDQFGPGRSPVVLGLDSGLHLAGMVVDGLTATRGGLGLLSDVARHAGEACGRIGDPEHDGYR